MNDKLSRQVARRAMLGIGVSAAALMAAPAFAQDAPVRTAPSDSGDYTVESITITAQRRSEENIKVPVAVTALGAEELQDITANNVTDIAFKIPNVLMSSGSISPSISIRGVSSQSNYAAGFPPAVGVYVDEVYQGRDPTFNVSLNDIERIEVLRGPQGTLYGKNTIGGAINLITADPSNDFTAFGDVQFGNYDMSQFRATVGGAIVPDLLMVRLSVVHAEREGFIRNTFRNTYLNDFSGNGARLVIGSQPNDRLKIRLSADYFKQVGSQAAETGPVSFLVPLPIFATVPPQDPSDNVVQLNTDSFAKRELGGGSVRVDYDLGFANLTSITAYRSYMSDFEDDSDGISLDGFNVGREENGENFSQELRLTSTGEGPFAWIGGFYYYAENTENNRRIRTGPNFPQLLAGLTLPGYGERARTESRIEGTSWALFASGTYQLSDQLRLAGGLRYTSESKDFTYHQYYTQAYGPAGPCGAGGLFIPCFAVNIPQRAESYEEGQVTGDISLSYDYSDDQVFSIRYSRGFKAGGFNTDVISPPFNPADALGFAPEFLDSYEAGYKSFWFSRRVSLNIAAFYLSWKDKQEQIDLGTSFLVRNAASASNKGIEIEVTARPTRYLTLDFNGAMQRAQYEEFPADPASEGKAFGLPEFTGSVGGQFVKPVNDAIEFYLRGDVIYRGESFVNTANTLANEATTRINGRIGFQSTTGGWGAYLWGKNIADEITPSGGTFRQVGIYGYTVRGADLGRTWGVELRKRF